MSIENPRIEDLEENQDAFCDPIRSSDEDIEKLIEMIGKHSENVADNAKNIFMTIVVSGLLYSHFNNLAENTSIEVSQENVLRLCFLFLFAFTYSSLKQIPKEVNALEKAKAKLQVILHR